MDYTSESCQKQFMAMRRDVNKQMSKADPVEQEEVAIDCFNEIVLKAVKNDPIAQDYLAYVFKKGLRNVIPVNYEKFMQWQILAGANGNQFSIDKLNLFLNYGYNEIMLAEDFGYLITKNNLTESNFNYVVGRLFCEAMADELMLDPEALAKEQVVHKEFDAKIMRVFDRARKFSIPKILKFLRN